MRSSKKQKVASDSDSDAVMIDRDDISNYNPDQILPESPEIVQKIRAWLKPTSYDIVGGEYRKHLACHVKGTGEWLTSSETYQQWLKSEELGLLWIRGIPGSGKSVMAANLIRELAQTNPGCPVLYFFFRQIIDANHEPKALLRDWLDQVLDYSPPLQQQLKAHVENRRSIDSFSLDDLLKHLRIAFSGLPGKVFCVADALDEMDQGNDAFLQALGSLGQWRPEKIKVLITSRPVPRVELPLRKVPCLHIRLQEDLVDIDISTYVLSTLSKSTIPESEWQVITDAVPGRANGLFLYAKLAMDAFLEPGANVGDVLSQLPADLNVLYTELLAEHGRRSGVPPEIQRLILQTVTHAARPLRLLELAEMIKENTDGDFTQSLKATKDLIRAACGPLLEILADETVSVIHHSFTEYLKGTTRSDDNSGYPILRAGLTHAQLAMACLNYLQAGCLSGIEIKYPTEDDGYSSYDSEDDGVYSFSPNNVTQLRLKHPFFDYAVNNWSFHIKQSETARQDQTEIISRVEEFFEDTSRMEAWLQIKWPKSDAGPRGVTQLHIAARAGLISYTKHLAGIMNVDSRDAIGRTALWWAASDGHSVVVRELIAAGADPDQQDARMGRKPLHEAASMNHFETVRVLLEARVDPLTKKTRENPGRWCGNAPRTVGQTALMYACQNGHVETVEVFLPFLKDIDMVHRALAWAAGSGRSKVVARLLQHPGVDVNAKVYGDTPLFLACKLADVATLEVLLEAGADPCIKCLDCNDEFASGMSPRFGPSKGLDCLHRLCQISWRKTRSQEQNNSQDLGHILTAFIQAGADVDQRTASGATILHGALGSPPLTRLLLGAGADANALDKDGATPLHRAKGRDIVELLVEEGHADIDLKMENGRTPLLNMLTGYDQEGIMKLLQYGPNCNTVDNEGNSALHTSLQHWNMKPETIKALLEAGGDPNLRNREGFTPLSSMHFRDHRSEELIDVLLAAGADINATSHSGQTLLLRLLAISSFGCGRDANQYIQHLVDRGASVSARDFQGRTALHQVVRHHDPNGRMLTPDITKFDFLVGLGLDIQAVDHKGNGLLHELALHKGNYQSFLGPRLVSFWERLVSLGLNLEQQNHAGRTPLHYLCSDTTDSTRIKPGTFMPIDLVILKSKNLNIADNDGITPLHLAASQGQVCVKKLLDAGADPKIPTNQGLTPLHIAARCRESNVVGMLLDALKEKSQGTTPIPGVNSIAQTDKRANPLTPLCCACQSGIPETVTLLLEAGADPKIGRIFEACLGFEDENAFWKMHEHQQDRSELVLKPNYSWTDHWTSPRIGKLYAETQNQTTRLEEILELLVKYGADSKDLDVSNWSNHTGAILAARKFDYTLLCFQDARKRFGSPKMSREKYNIPAVFSELVSDALRDLSISKLRDSGCITTGKSNAEMFNQFLARREYYLVEEMARLGADFFPSLKDRNDHSNLGTLIQGGFASLVDKTGTTSTKSALTTGEWHAFGDDTRPGLWFAKRDLTKTGVECFVPMPFLMMAVRRTLPNMDVIRLLVEKFSVDINELQYAKEPVGNSYQLAPTETALHYVARGNSWWHAHQALPYLLKAGADMNVRTRDGQTPLHMALQADGNWPGPFSVDAAKILIEAGADVNATNGKGQSCLVCAQNQVEVIGLLKDHGAKVTADAILAAIDAESFEGLEELLSGGIDPNIRLERIPEDPASAQKKDQGRRRQDQELEPHEKYPLYHAGSKLGLLADSHLDPLQRSAKVAKMVQILLNHGADPFATFLEHEEKPKHTSATADTLTRNVTRTSVPEGYVQCTVLHQLLLDSKVIDPFLDLPSLDVNHRDSMGHTLLHAACDNRTGPDYIVDSYQWNAPAGSGVTLFQKLLSLGADLQARDDIKRNVLHMMIGHVEYPYVGYGFERYCKSFTESLEKTPELSNQADENGETPLHYAVKLAARIREVRAAGLLLSAGANPLATTHKGDTVLHLMARDLSTEKLRTLFQNLAERGVDVNARNNKGETPLFAFFDRIKETIPRNRLRWDKKESEFAEKDAIPIFQSLGADFFARDDRGRGLLHVAASGEVAGFKLLMELGLDGMLEDYSQQTAIDVAAACDNEDVLELFEKKH